MEVGLDEVRPRPSVAVSVPESFPAAASALSEIQCRADDQTTARTLMYISGLPSLNPAQFLANRAMENLPFPLRSPLKTYFYVARNGVYHLMRSLHSSGDEIVLAPD